MVVGSVVDGATVAGGAVVVGASAGPASSARRTLASTAIAPTIRITAAATAHRRCRPPCPDPPTSAASSSGHRGIGAGSSSATRRAGQPAQLAIEISRHGAPPESGTGTGEVAAHRPSEMPRRSAMSSGVRSAQYREHDDRPLPQAQRCDRRGHRRVDRRRLEGLGASGGRRLMDRAGRSPTRPRPRLVEHRPIQVRPRLAHGWPRRRRHRLHERRRHHVGRIVASDEPGREPDQLGSQSLVHRLVARKLHVRHRVRRPSSARHG